MNGEQAPGPSPQTYLSRLLARLNEDPDQAARSYEDLRRRVILFLRLKRPPDAEHLADEVLDRVGRRLAEGVEIQSIASYTLGVARFVLREHEAAAVRDARAAAELAYQQQVHTSVTDPVAEEQVRALQQCLGRLQAAERTMLFEYYGTDGLRRIQVRQALAGRMGISLNALHNRALRLRKALEQCVERRVRQELR